MTIVIPPTVRPVDGRFGSGPSKIPLESVAELVNSGRRLLGTSHRQSPVRSQVRALQEGLLDFYGAPDGYEVLLAVGGATAFWDAAVFGLIEHRSQHYVFGEMSSKFAAAATLAPWLADPLVIEAESGCGPTPTPAPTDVDVHAWTHNETTTGVMQDVHRLDDALVVVDGTSAVAGLPVDLSQVDVYFFSLQKGFAADGGLTLAILSPQALERITAISATDRYVPAFFDLAIAAENSRAQQTYNTPAIATIVLARAQMDALLTKHGDLAGAVAAQRRKSDHLYGWAERKGFTTPFVEDPTVRSLVVATIDLVGVAASELNHILSANGIVGTECHRKVQRNQLRIGMFPAIEQGDIEALTASIDFVVERLPERLPL